MYARPEILPIAIKKVMKGFNGPYEVEMGVSSLVLGGMDIPGVGFVRLETREGMVLLW